MNSENQNQPDLHQPDLHQLAHLLTQRNAELALLSSIQEALLSQKEIQVVFELVGERLTEMFEGFVISVATFDHETEMEHFQFHFEEGKRMHPEPRPYNQIRKLLIESHQQLLVNEKAENFVNELIGAQYFIESDIAIPKSFFFAPFMVDDVVRGYISLKHYQTETAFDEEHIRLFNTIAGSISVTLQNDGLIQSAQRKAAEQKALLDTMTDLSKKLELNHLLSAVLERAVDILKVFGGELAIYHEELEELEIVASHNLGMNSGGVHLKHGEGAMGRVADTKQALIIPDYQDWEGRSNKYTKTTVHSVMVVPLLIGDQLLGVVAVVHLDKHNKFSAEDLDLLNLFAPLAATAIENARLFEAEKKKAGEQEALLDTMKDLSGKLELKALLQSVVKRSVELLQVTGGELAIFHPEEKQLEIVASLNLGMESLGLRLELGEGAMGTAAANQETLLIPDYQTWASKSTKYTETKVHSVMVVPLMIKDQLVGALCSVHLEKDRVFNQRDLRLLNLFAPLAATAIENARLFEKTNKLLEEAEQRTALLKNTQHQLIQQEKLASLGELIAGIAHEIQNPLNFVNNFSEVNTELLEELIVEIDKGDTSEAKAIVQDIQENEQKINHHGKRADSIVKGMLQHSKSTTGIKEPADINAIADEYLRLAYHGLRAKDKSFNATLETEYDTSIENIHIIPQDIGRVILNLISNAFYSVDEKKKQQPTGFEPTVTVSTKIEPGFVVVQVKDNGNGIPQKVIDKIFQPFFTTKPTGKGTGLGLSLSYDIVKAHGGELKVETKEGEGTEFSIWLNR